MCGNKNLHSSVISFKIFHLNLFFTVSKVIIQCGFTSDHIISLYECQLKPPSCGSSVELQRRNEQKDRRAQTYRIKSKIKTAFLSSVSPPPDTDAGRGVSFTARLQVVHGAPSPHRCSPEASEDRGELELKPGEQRVNGHLQLVGWMEAELRSLGKCNNTDVLLRIESLGRVCCLKTQTGLCFNVSELRTGGGF